MARQIQVPHSSGSHRHIHVYMCLSVCVPLCVSCVCVCLYVSVYIRTYVCIYLNHNTLAIKQFVISTSNQNRCFHMNSCGAVKKKNSRNLIFRILYLSNHWTGFFEIWYVRTLMRLHRAYTQDMVLIKINSVIFVLLKC